MDVSSCNMGGEIMQVAAELPTGLVDHIIAGHVHQGIAHIVNRISITSSYSNTRAFSRVDLDVDRTTGHIVSRNVHPPTSACLSVVRSSGDCALPDANPAETARTVYEGREIAPNAAVLEIATQAAAFAAATKDEKLGVYLESAFEIPTSTESALGILMTDALLESIDADVAIHNVMGGIRNGLPQGDLTFGAVYEMFPFDNRIVVLNLTGRQLREIIAKQAHRGRRRAGFAGMRVIIGCDDNGMDVVMERTNGTVIQDNDLVRLIANDYLALGGDDILTPVMPEGGFDIDDGMPRTRDVLLKWFRNRTDALDPGDFLLEGRPRWNAPRELPEFCTL
jgi:5'-nucleotidase